MDKRKTKIICTLGPASRDENVLKQLIGAGLNVARLNFSHGDHEYHQQTIDTVKKVRDELGEPISILLDTKGPEVRIKTFENGSVDLNVGDEFFFTSKDIVGTEKGVSVTYGNIEKEVFVGDVILLNNGLISFEVTDVNKSRIMTKVTGGGNLSDRKSMNFPGKVFDFPYMSEQDKKDIALGVQNDVEFIACSFVSCKEDVIAVREYVEALGGKDIELIAKIENRAGVDNIEEILEVSDGIMVARGDMGVEIPYEELPAIQKKLITDSRYIGKKVITATEMLESMIQNPRPTRAEISDVANAVYDGTSAIMLSGETAIGKYPVETVKAMAKIAYKTEKSIKLAKRMKSSTFRIRNAVDAVSYSTCTMSVDLGAKLIVVCTLSGKTALMVSRFRGPVPILAMTASLKSYRKLGLSWGVTPVLTEEVPSTDVLFYNANKLAKSLGYAEKDDFIVITAGTPIGSHAETNLIKIETIK
ncbi:MAG: pyruvate kinase [Bacillota bacterium]